MIYLTAQFKDAHITKLDPRGKGKGKVDKKLAYFLNICGVVPVSFLNDLAVADAVDYENILFLEDGALKQTFIDHIAFSRSFDDHKLKVNFDLISENFMVFHGVKFNNFKAQPIFDKHLKVSFRAEFNPVDEEVKFLNKAFILSKLAVDILPPDEIDLNQGALDFGETSAG